MKISSHYTIRHKKTGKHVVSAHHSCGVIGLITADVIWQFTRDQTLELLRTLFERDYGLVKGTFSLHEENFSNHKSAKSFDALQYFLKEFEICGLNPDPTVDAVDQINLMLNKILTNCFVEFKRGFFSKNTKLSNLGRRIQADPQRSLLDEIKQYVGVIVLDNYRPDYQRSKLKSIGISSDVHVSTSFKAIYFKTDEAVNLYNLLLVHHGEKSPIVSLSEPRKKMVTISKKLNTIRNEIKIQYPRNA